jgi:hypothetical protein
MKKVLAGSSGFDTIKAQLNISRIWALGASETD